MKFTKKILSLLCVYFFIFNTSVNAQQQGFLGEIRMFAGNFPPRGWAFCQGQILEIYNHDRLFSILGTTYGGDGRTSFALPDLRGRVPMGQGKAPGLSSYQLGQKLGTETRTLTTNNLPSHTHRAVVNNSNTTTDLLLSKDPAVRIIPQEGDIPATANYSNPNSVNSVKSFGPATNTVNGQEVSSSSPTISIGDTGSNAPFSNYQPTLVINYIICVDGSYPSRQ